MRKWMLASAVAVVLALTVGIVGTVLAETNGPTATSNAGRGLGVGIGFGFAFRGLPDTISPLLGLTEEQIETQRHEGKSLVEIAKNAPKSADEATLVNAILAERQKAVDAKVADGSMTKEQATQVIERMKTRVQEMVNSTAIGPKTDAQMGQGMRNGRSGDGTGSGPRSQGSSGECIHGNQASAKAQ